MTMKPCERRTTVRGIELASFEWGPRDAQTVLMVHATGFHARCWDATVGALGEGYRVIAVDQRGHGRSDKTGPFNWQEFGADMTEFVDAFDLRDAIGVGHSMGGHTVVQAAARRPKRFERLVLVDPVIMEPGAYDGWADDRPFSNAQEHPVARRRADFDSWEDMFERFRDRHPFKLWRVDVLQDYCRHGILPKPNGGGYTLACPPVVESSIYMGSGGTDIYDSVRTLPHPVLVVRARRREIRQGEMDFSQSPTWEGLAGAFRHGRDVYRPELTHFIPMQHPELVAAAIATPESLS